MKDFDQSTTISLLFILFKIFIGTNFIFKILKTINIDLRKEPFFISKPKSSSLNPALYL